MVFAGARDGEWLWWDDDINITANPHLDGLTGENLRWMFTDYARMRRYVPLAWLDWAIDYELFGLTAKSAHVGNILLHVVNALLVFALLRRVLERWRAAPAPGAWWVELAAGIGALAWAWHPLRVEVVAWASGRIYCQAACFVLLATLMYLSGGYAAAAPSRRRWWLAGSVLAFAASLLTYPIGIGYVAVLVVLDVWVLRRLKLERGFWRARETRAVLAEKIPFLAVAMVVAGVTLVARFRASGVWEPPPALAEFGLASRVAQAFYIWAHYLWRPLWPADLAPLYTTLIEFKPWDGVFAASAAGVVGTTVLLIWKRRRWPGALAWWLAHLAVLGPVLGVTEHPHYPNDRYSYLQGVLPAMAVAACVGWVWVRRSRAVVIAGMGACLGALGLASAAQIRVWRDSETLFRHLHAQLAGDPYRADIAQRLGETLRLQRRFGEAAAFYEESLRIDPPGFRREISHFGLGDAAHRAGRVAEARAHYEQAIALNPRFAEAYSPLAQLLITTDQPRDAIGVCRRGLSLTPGDPMLHYAHGMALVRVGESKGAIEALGAAVRLQPAHAPARSALAKALVATGRARDAVPHAEAAVRHAPHLADAHYCLGMALRDLQRFPEAAAAFEAALRAASDHAPAREALARLPR